MNAKNKAEEIWSDLTDRSGFDLDIDDEVKEEILTTWANIILK